MKDVKKSDSNPGPQVLKSNALTARLRDYSCRIDGNLWYLCTVLINVYVAGPDPDPNPRGGGSTT